MVVIQRLRKSKLGMKKISTTIFALILSATVFAQQNTWPSALGNVSFATDSTWTISREFMFSNMDNIFQIWSDAVQTDKCSRKESFNGGSFEEGFNIDCRSNPDQKGDLFSWRAVFEFKYELCPYPWRVPTRQDFINLDMALGGGGMVFRCDRRWSHIDKYFNNWGGVFGGRSNSKGYLVGQNLRADYWSQEPSFGCSAYTLSFTDTKGHIFPQNCIERCFGASLRCVRDK